MRNVIVSPAVLGKLSDLGSYLKDDIKLSLRSGTGVP